VKWDENLNSGAMRGVPGLDEKESGGCLEDAVWLKIAQLHHLFEGIRSS